MKSANGKNKKKVENERKRKVQNQNVSGESVNKVKVTTDQGTFSIPRLSSMNPETGLSLPAPPMYNGSINQSTPNQLHYGQQNALAGSAG